MTLALANHRDGGAGTGPAGPAGPAAWLTLRLPPAAGQSQDRTLDLRTEMEAIAWVERLGERLFRNRRENAALRIDLGVALLAARERIRHGAWDYFLERCRIDPRLARRCMQTVRALMDLGVDLGGPWLSWRQVEMRAGVRTEAEQNPVEMRPRTHLTGTWDLEQNGQAEQNPGQNGERAVLTGGTPEGSDDDGDFCGDDTEQDPEQNGERAVLTGTWDERHNGERADEAGAGDGRPVALRPLAARPLTARVEAPGQMDLSGLYERARAGVRWLREALDGDDLTADEAGQVARMVEAMRARRNGNSSSATDGASLTLRAERT